MQDSILQTEHRLIIHCRQTSRPNNWDRETRMLKSAKSRINQKEKNVKAGEDCFFNMGLKVAI